MNLILALVASYPNIISVSVSSLISEMSVGMSSFLKSCGEKTTKPEASSFYSNTSLIDASNCRSSPIGKAEPRFLPISSLEKTLVH